MRQERKAIATTTISLVVIIIVLTGTLGGVLLTWQPATHTLTSVSTQTTTQCILYAETYGVVIRILTNATSPIVGAQITGQSVGYCNDLPQISSLQPTTTNSSGWATLLDGGIGIYYLNISFSVEESFNLTEHSLAFQYNLSIPTEIGQATYVIFNPASGNVTTRF